MGGSDSKGTPLDNTPIRLGIAGAGPAGLCIAGILAREAPGRFEIEVFERDSRERDQGAGWDLNANARKVLSRAGVNPATISRPGFPTDQWFKTHSDSPYLVLHKPFPCNRCKKDNPETSRHAMREALLNELKSNAIVSFGSGVFDLRQNDKNGVTCLNANGEVMGEYDLVIDACGVGSPIRKYRVPGTEVKDWYTGITCLGGIIQDPEAQLHPELVRRLGPGSLMVLGERHDGNGAMHLFFQRFGAVEEDHRAQFGFIVHREGPGDLCQELGVTPSGRPISETEQKDTVEQIKVWMRQEMGDRWDQMYVDSLEAVTNINIRPLYMFDTKVLPDAKSTLPFVCVGDSLHALPPFTASGGNLALEDAGEFATFLVNYALGREKAGLLPGIRAIELKCFDRAAKVADGKGQRIQASVVRNLKAQNVCKTFSLAVMLKGENWTCLKRVAYTILPLFMCIHSLSDYGMARKSKPKQETA